MTARRAPIEPSESSMWDALGRPPGADLPAHVTICWITSARARDLSAGEVRVTESLDPESFVPVPGGLFCERIFGAVPRRRDGRADLFAALDQRYKAAPTDDDRAAGFVSERRAVGWYGRTGHIELATSVPHPWWGDRDDAPGVDTLLVLPPGLRPVFPINARTGDPFDVGPAPRFVDSDLNALYRRVLIANARLRARLASGRDDVDALRDRLRDELAALVANETCSNPRTSDGRVLRSLALALGADRDLRWRHALELDALAGRDTAALDGPLREPLFSFVAALRCVGLELRPRIAAGDRGSRGA